MEEELKPLTVLKKLRTDRKLSRKALAQELNIGEATIQAYEDGLRKPSLDRLQQIADYFSVPVDYILGNIDYDTELVQFAFNGMLDDMRSLTPEEMSDVHNFIKFTKNKKNNK